MNSMGRWDWWMEAEPLLQDTPSPGHGREDLESAALLPGRRGGLPRTSFLAGHSANQLRWWGSLGKRGGCCPKRPWDQDTKLGLAQKPLRQLLLPGSRARLQQGELRQSVAKCTGTLSDLKS